jgi:hypothetical protein
VISTEQTPLWPSAIRGPALIRRISNESSKPSTPRSPVEQAWGCRYAVPSSLPLAVGAACGFSLAPSARRSTGSHVPYESLVALRAAYMPDVARAVSAISRADPGGRVPPVLTSPHPLSTLLQRFACARLSRPCLAESRPGVSATLTTAAFDRSSLRWLEINT